MIVRDADATRARLLEAATAEFAAYGIAGARVDRIAEAARANKAQIYHYFGSKDGLFDAVFGAYAEAATASGYFDAHDLAETAGRIFDDMEAHPEVARLASWYRLERGADARLIAGVATANEAKIAAIRRAQEAGEVAALFPPDVLLGLVLTIAMAWTSLPPEFAGIRDGHASAERRRYVVDAVARLVSLP